MTLKFNMFTNPIGPKNKVYMIRNISIEEYENTKQYFKRSLSTEGRKHIQLELATTTRKIHYDFKCTNIKDFKERISELYPIELKKKLTRLDLLKDELRRNDIKFYETNSSTIELTFYFFNQSYVFNIYMDEDKSFEIDLYINGSFEALYNGYAYDGDFKQPHSMTYYEDEYEPFTIEQIVKIMKTTTELEDRVVKIKNDLPF